MFFVFCFFLYIEPLLLSFRKDRGLPSIRALPAGPGSRKHRHKFQRVIRGSGSHNSRKTATRLHVGPCACLGYDYMAPF